ncbi:MAG TPA: YibE/F family protein [Solirubrobacterales bacterium]|nr:YibE/F family protein [Solirubrobacterales bacterium]
MNRAETEAELEDRPRRDRSNHKKIFVGVVAAVAVATLVGLAVLWPSGDSEFQLGTGPVGDTEKGEIRTVNSRECPPPRQGTCTDAEVEIVSGEEAGKVVPIQISTGGPTAVYEVGDKVRVAKVQFAPSADQFEASQVEPVYSLIDFERRAPMIWLALAFALLVVLFGRLRGALSLVGLAASLGVVLLFIVPAILDGKPPLAVALVGSMAVMLVTIALAHGLGPKSLAAILGTAFSLLLVGVMAVIFTGLTNLTGFSSEEATALAVSDSGISISGLLIAGIVIGALGVLDDVTISQASTVLALRAANPTQRFGALYRRAIDVGRDHVSATVNTLVLAYVGSSLPVLVILGSGQLGIVDAVNLELIAKEIVATLVGSIGLIAAVPITTALAALMADTLSDEELHAAAEGGHQH